MTFAGKFVLVIALCCTFSLHADSPLTSAYFAINYYEYPIVGIAETGHEITDEVAKFLLDETNPIDVKAAVINAIGWNYDGTNNAQKFKEYLAKSHLTSTEKLILSDLTADELMCMGYLIAMDDYFVMDEAINILELAVNKNQTSFTINLILTLVKAQKAMDLDFCKVWSLTSGLLNDKDLKRDIKTSAIQGVVDYMILYKQDCVY